MGKLISWIALIFFVVVVPFISWYYLKLGYNYRKQILSEVRAKDSIHVSLDSLSLLRSKTTLLILNSSNKTANITDGIREQFKNVNGFQIASFDSLSSAIVLPDNYIEKTQSKYKASVLLLIDTSLKIRNAYNDNPESIRKLIEHIAVILPRQKDADIKMKQ